MIISILVFYHMIFKFQIFVVLVVILALVWKIILVSGKVPVKKKKRVQHTELDLEKSEQTSCSILEPARQKNEIEKEKEIQSERLGTLPVKFSSKLNPYAKPFVPACAINNSQDEPVRDRAAANYHDNLPANTHDNLPVNTHDNLPANTHDNLPVLKSDYREIEYISLINHPGTEIQRGITITKDLFLELSDIRSSMSKLRLMADFNMQCGKIYLAIPDQETAQNHNSLIGWRRALAENQKFILPTQFDDTAVKPWRRAGPKIDRPGSGQLWRVSRFGNYPLFIITIKSGLFSA